jgi:hypothetical protein
MAVADTRSTELQNKVASPPVLNLAGNDAGFIRTSKGKVEVAAADDDNSTYGFCEIPSNAILSNIWLKNDAIAGGTDYNIGLRETQDNGSDTISGGANLFGDAVDMSSARVTPNDILHENLDINNYNKRAWELLGLTEDPRKNYELYATGITVGTVAGGIYIDTHWSV